MNPVDTARPAPHNFRTLDLNLLRVFDAVMTDGSLTRAGETLAMTQPAVSHALKRLRTTLGEELFVRNGSGVKPTERAQAIWPQVQGALNALRQALVPDEFHPRSDPVTFTVAMADAPAAILTPPVICAFTREQALANLRVVPITTRDPSRLLEQGEADLAIGYFPELVPALEMQGDVAHMRHRRLFESPYVCVMRRGHPLAHQELTLERYCRAQHLLVSFSGRRQGLVDHALAGLGRERRIVLTVNTFFAAGRVVTATDLLTVLPSHFVDAAGHGPELITRPLPFELPPMEIGMVWHLRRDADAAQRWLRGAFLRSASLA